MLVLKVKYMSVIGFFDFQYNSCSPVIRGAVYQNERLPRAFYPVGCEPYEVKITNPENSAFITDDDFQTPSERLRYIIYEAFSEAIDSNSFQPEEGSLIDGQTVSQITAEVCLPPHRIKTFLNNLGCDPSLKESQKDSGKIEIARLTIEKSFKISESTRNIETTFSNMTQEQTNLMKKRFALRLVQEFLEKP